MTESKGVGILEFLKIPYWGGIKRSSGLKTVVKSKARKMRNAGRKRGPRLQGLCLPLLAQAGRMLMVRAKSLGTGSGEGGLGGADWRGIRRSRGWKPPIRGEYLRRSDGTVPSFRASSALLKQCEECLEAGNHGNRTKRAHGGAVGGASDAGSWSVAGSAAEQTKGGFCLQGESLAAEFPASWSGVACGKNLSIATFWCRRR